MTNLSISKSELSLSEGVWADQPMLKVVGWSIPNFYGLWGLREVLVFDQKELDQMLTLPKSLVLEWFHILPSSWAFDDQHFQ